MITFKEYFKIKEEEGDFGDDANDASAKQTVMNTVDNKAKRKWVEARGFIEPSGKINRIDTMPHEHYAMDLGHASMVDGRLVNKKYKDVKDLCLNTGLIRWSPETSSFTVFTQMTPEQVKVIKTIIKAYGYVGLNLEYLNRQTGEMESVEFNDANPKMVDSKIARVQHRVSDK
jgi:hypothetical protein